MSLDAWIASAITLSTLLVLALSRLPPHRVLLAALAAVVIAGVVPASRALSGFANPGVATIAALFVVVAGVRHAGVLERLGPWLLGRKARAGIARLRLVLPTATASAFMNNTPVVALVIPVIHDWCRQHRIAPSKLLLPLSYAAILGGTCTLIGTSTNLVIDGLMSADGGSPMGIFTPAIIGVPVTLVALTVMLLSARWLLPDRQPALDSADDPRQFTVELLVSEGSPVVGRSISEAGLRHLPAVYLVAILRDGEMVEVPQPSERLHAGDRLIFAGNRDGVAEVASRKGLTLATDDTFRADHPMGERVLVEAVVAHSSPLIGRTVNQAAFRTHYHAAVMAVARHGQRMSGGLGDHQLQAGDILLLETVPTFHEQFAHSPDFYVMSKPEHGHDRDHRRAPLALAILVAMVAVAASGLLSILSAAICAAVLMLATGCCSIAQARSALDSRLLIAIASAFGLGAALDGSGAAAAIAGLLLQMSAADPWWTLVAVYVATVIITELVTNNAAAIIMWPIALGAAIALEVSVMPFALAIMIAASASFLTPLGYQTNLMVCGPGGYRYLDFLRFGTPVAISVALVALLLIPWAFPF